MYPATQDCSDNCTVSIVHTCGEGGEVWGEGSQRFQR